MEIKYGGNKMSAKMYEINNFEYLQKVISTEMLLEIWSNIYAGRFLASNDLQ